MDAHFQQNKVCTALGKPLAVNAFNGIKDTPGAPPESSPVVHGIAVTCFMLHQGSDLKVSSSELLDRYEGIMWNPRIKMSFCVHPTFAGVHLTTPTKHMEAADAVMSHIQMPGVVAAGELGIDHHRNRDSVSRTNSREFLLFVLKQILAHPTLKDLTLVLHVREARLDSDVVAVKCIHTMHHAGLHADHKVCLHCYVAGRATQRMWMNNFQNTVFGAGLLLVEARCHFEVPPLITKLEWQQIMVETNAPSIHFDGRKDEPRTMLMSTYEVIHWLASVRNVPLREVLQEVRKSFHYSYGL